MSLPLTSATQTVTVTVTSSMGTLVATSICLYRMRRLEPLLGSRKFGAFAVVTHLMSLPLEAAAVVNSGTLKLTSGPLPFVFALLVLYYAVVPPTKPRFFGALGMDFSDKSLTYCVAGMVSRVKSLSFLMMGAA